MALELTRQEIHPPGFTGATVTTPSLVTADATDTYFLNDGRTFLWVKNGATASTITITKQKASIKVEGYGDVAMSDMSWALGTTVDKFIQCPSLVYNDGNGKVHCSFSSVVTVTVGAFRLLEA